MALKEKAKTITDAIFNSVGGKEQFDEVSILLDMNDKKGWLSGALMDYIFCIFARKYKKCIFLPTMFAAHDLHRAHMENKIDQLESFYSFNHMYFYKVILLSFS